MNLIIWALCIVALCFGPRAAHAESGIASFYCGHRTADGEIMNCGDLTAAHRSLPFGPMVRVTNRSSGRSIVVRINDRGPFVKGRVIDITPEGKRELGMGGTTPVILDVLGHSP